ncbi:MAG: MgtC/SapB family protein [Bacilli bacterium]|nr:MgtC/SapB family protein [Bacilli bacterium]
MMEYLEYVVNTELFQICFKLVLSCILAGIIGLERSSMSKPAGFGTHAIIGLSATLVVLASQYMSKYYDMDVSRIPAQILSGIGFIGAGTIIRNGINVRGVTTAAGILSVTCIGLAVGAGYYPAAILTTIIVFLVLSHNQEIRGKFERFEGIDLVITVADDLGDALEDIKKYFKKEDIHIQSVKKDSEVIKSKKNEVLKVSVTYDTKKLSKSDIISTLISLDKVKEVTEED